MNERKAADEGKAFWKKRLTKENMAVVALLGLLLMVIAIPTGRKEEEDGGMLPAAEAGVTGRDEDTEEEDYVRNLEARLEELLASMDGVGHVKVMVTLQASREQVVEKDIPSEMDTMKETDSAGGTRETVSSSQQESTIYTVDPAGNKVPYVIKIREPEVEGVTVVAQGGGDVTVQKNITEVIQALFDIEAHKIRVVKMKPV